MTAPVYATYQGRPVQVRETFSARPDCHVCGGDGWVESGTCPGCNGSGYEPKKVEWAKVGFLSGPEAGTYIVVRASALIPSTEDDVVAKMAEWENRPDPSEAGHDFGRNAR